MQTVTRFAPDKRGVVGCRFAIDHVHVFVAPMQREDNERAYRLSCELAQHYVIVESLQRRIQSREDALVSLQTQFDRMLARYEPDDGVPTPRMTPIPPAEWPQT